MGATCVRKFQESTHKDDARGEFLAISIAYGAATDKAAVAS